MESDSKLFKMFIKEFIEENQKGNVKDIIRYLLDKDLFLQDLTELKELIEKILIDFKNDNIINYFPNSQNFSTLSFPKEEFYPFKNELDLYQHLLYANLIRKDKESKFEYEKLNEYLANSLNLIGQYNFSLVDNEKKVLIAIFETSLVEVKLNISNDSIIIISVMKTFLNKNEPIITHITNLSSRSLKKVKTISIPLNFGIYLIFNLILDFLSRFHPDFSLRIELIEFKE